MTRLLVIHTQVLRSLIKLYGLFVSLKIYE